MNLKLYFVTGIPSQYPVGVANYTVGGKLAAVPRHAYVGVLRYRTDPLQRL